MILPTGVAFSLLLGATQVLAPVTALGLVDLHALVRCLLAPLQEQQVQQDADFCFYLGRDRVRNSAAVATDPGLVVYDESLVLRDVERGFHEAGDLIVFDSSQLFVLHLQRRLAGQDALSAKKFMAHFLRFINSASHALTRLI